MLKENVLIFLAVIFFAAVSFAVEPEVAPPPQSVVKQSQFTGQRVFGLKYDAFGFIDPSSDVIPLQNLPRDSYDFVDWSKAIQDNIIAPVDFITDQQEQVVLFSKDVVIKSKMDFMPDVLFPHEVHNFWLSCNTCHPRLFEMKAGATPISMVDIWNGEFCGRCHDRVAFPLRNCFKCHSVKKRAEKP